MYELITEKTLPEYEAFIQRHPQGHFAQSSLWGKQKTAWQFRAVAVRGENGAIKGALGVLIRGSDYVVSKLMGMYQQATPEQMMPIFLSYISMRFRGDSSA